jgi:hypothetical protein
MNHGKCDKSTCNSEISKCRLELPHKQSHALNTTGGSCTETGTSTNYILLEVVPKKKFTEYVKKIQNANRCFVEKAKSHDAEEANGHRCPQSQCLMKTQRSSSPPETWALCMFVSVTLGKIIQN